MFKAMADMINSSEDYKDNPVSASSIEMWFFIGLGIIFELVAILTAYLAQLKGTLIGFTGKKDTLTDNSIGFKPKLVTASLTSNDTTTNLTDADYIDEPVKKMQLIGFYSGAAAASTGANKNMEQVKSLEDLSQTNIDGFSKTDLMNYIEFMYQNKKSNNESPGCKKIFENVGTGSKLEDFRKIRGYIH
jgi:hypothetical protein